MVKIGVERAAGASVIARGVDEAKALSVFPSPGHVYRIEAKVSKPIGDEDAADKLVDVLRKVRSEYPGIMVTYAEVSGDSVVIEFIDDPIGVVLGVIIIGILAVVSLSIVYLVVRELGSQGALPPSSFWKYIAVAAVLGAAGYIAGKIFGLFKRR